MSSGAPCIAAIHRVGVKRRSAAPVRRIAARWLIAFSAALAGSAARPPVARAQDSAAVKLRNERQKLDQLRREREQLEQRRNSLRSTVHDLSEEVQSLDSEADMTARVVASLDSQLATINGELESTTTDLIRTQDELTLGQAILQRRLVDIYKRGSLYSAEVLLSANSFGDLVARYKYLHLLTLRDRALVERVAGLRDRIGRQRGNLVQFQRDMQESLQEKADEEQRLRDLRNQQAGSLKSAKERAQDTDRRLAQISRDEKRLGDVIASLEAARLRAERAGTNVSREPSTLRAGGARFAWPVDGPLEYSFGRVVNPNNTTVRWNGIGIEAPAGTPVHAIAAGKVLVAESFGTYGLTVIIQHPGGDYSVYGSLSRIATEKGAVVGKGEVIGYVGLTDPALGPHLHFELRPEGHAVDPLDYLTPKP